MSYYNMGQFIKLRRNELKVPQSELCRGICNVSTLSRIENGEQVPKSDILKMLLERLGYSDFVSDVLMPERDYNAVQTAYRARQLYNLGKKKEAKKLVDSLDNNYDSLRLQDRQFCDNMQTTFLRESGAITTEQALKNYIEILERSSGRFNLDSLPTVVYFEEMNLLNCIALCYARLGRTDITIKMLDHMKKVMESNIVDEFEYLRSMPGILYNLSKYLGLSKQYDESIEISEQAVELGKRANRTRTLPQSMYNLGWALIKRGRPQDRERARALIEDAYQLSRIMSGDSTRTQQIKQFITENFGD